MHKQSSPPAYEEPTCDTHSSPAHFGHEPQGMPTPAATPPARHEPGFPAVCTETVELPALTVVLSSETISTAGHALRSTDYRGAHAQLEAPRTHVGYLDTYSPAHRYGGFAGNSSLFTPAHAASVYTPRHHVATDVYGSATRYAGHHDQMDRSHGQQVIEHTRQIPALRLGMRMEVDAQSLARCDAALEWLRASQDPFAKLRVRKIIAVRNFRVTPEMYATCLPPPAVKGYHLALGELTDPNAHLRLASAKETHTKVERPQRFLEALRNRESKRAATREVTMVLVPCNYELERLFIARASSF